MGVHRLRGSRRIFSSRCATSGWACRRHGARPARRSSPPFSVAVRTGIARLAGARPWPARCAESCEQCRPGIGPVGPAAVRARPITDRIRCRQSSVSSRAPIPGSTPTLFVGRSIRSPPGPGSADNWHGLSRTVPSCSPAPGRRRRCLRCFASSTLSAKRAPPGSFGRPARTAGGLSTCPSSKTGCGSVEAARPVCGPFPAPAAGRSAIRSPATSKGGRSARTVSCAIPPTRRPVLAADAADR